MVTRLVASLLVVALGACAAPETARLAGEAADLPRRAAVADVPFFAQEDYFCGPAALAMALAWSGLAVTPEALVAQVYTAAREGTLRSDMVAAARRHGRLAVPVHDLRALAAELAAGHPVIVFQNLGLEALPQWHYAVAWGYDLDRRQLVLHSGLDAGREIALATFERTWARGGRWALVVLAPDRLPASADETAVLEAAIGIERAGRAAEAARAYETLLARWPENFVARVGLGNARYQAGDAAAAEAAFRAAIALRPAAAAPWNNLAHALAAQGRNDEARRAAARALRLAPASATYRETVERLAAPGL